MKKYTRDDTEHGETYYLASDVDGLLAQPDCRAVKTYHEGKPVYVSQPELRNFCPRCGKRAQGVLGQPQVHTCTPPLWGHQ